MTRKPQTQDSDSTVQRILETLDGYKAEHRRAKVDAYRRNSASVRIRILDPDFRGLNTVAREDDVWGLLNTLADEVRSEITMLVLLTPEEAKESLANLEFESPMPSLL